MGATPPGIPRLACLVFIRTFRVVHSCGGLGRRRQRILSKACVQARFPCVVVIAPLRGSRGEHRSIENRRAGHEITGHFRAPRDYPILGSHFDRPTWRCGNNPVAAFRDPGSDRRQATAP